MSVVRARSHAVFCLVRIGRRRTGDLPLLHGSAAGRGAGRSRIGARRNIAFADLLDEEFVGPVTGSALSEHLAWQSARLGRSLKPQVRLRGLDAVCRMVECGAGIAVVPETAARRCGRTVAFRMRRLTDVWATRQLIVCIGRMVALPAHARRLVEHRAGATRKDAQFR